jgi:hypothetical protein
LEQEVILLARRVVKEFGLGAGGSGEGGVERILECICRNVGKFGFIIENKSRQNVQESVVVQEFDMEPLSLNASGLETNFLRLHRHKATQIFL